MNLGNLDIPAPWYYGPCVLTGLNRPYEMYDLYHITPENRDNSYGINTGSKKVFLGVFRKQPSLKTTEDIVRLAAAAPDLLEALENIVDHHNSKDGDMKMLRHFILEGQKAITKATGI